MFLFGILLLAAGGALVLWPQRIAEFEARSWKWRYGIVAGSIGAGTRLYFRMRGAFLIVVGTLMMWRAWA